MYCSHRNAFNCPFSHPIAPDPIVSLSILSNYLPALHVGHNITIRCEMTVPPSVDVPLSVTVDWKWKGAELPEGNRLELVPVKRVSNQTYWSDLVFTEVTTDQIGSYECAYTIEEDNENEDVMMLSATSTAMTELAVKGTLFSPYHNRSLGQYTVHGIFDKIYYKSTVYNP